MARSEEGLKQAWESLAEGWRELGHRATGALTRFKASSSGPASQPGDDLPALPGWSLLGADLFEDDEKVVVRLEAPGMRRDDVLAVEERTYRQHARTVGCRTADGELKSVNTQEGDQPT